MKTIQQQKARQQQSALWKVFFVVRVGVSGGGGAHLFHRETSYRFLQQQIDVLSLQAPPFKETEREDKYR